MCKRALDIDDPILPALDLSEILEHVRMLGGPAVHARLTVELGREDTADRSLVLGWLYEREPVIYAEIEAIVRGFHSAYLIASETRELIFMLNHSLVVARQENDLKQQRINLLESQLVMERSMPPGEEQASPKKKKGRDKKKKENTSPPRATPELEAAQATFVAESVAKVPRSKDADEQASFYSKIEPWSELFDVSDYIHFVPKPRQRMELKVLTDFSQWKSLYHVGGPWAAEMLEEKLNEEGYKAVAIKRRRGGADQEPFCYKVVSTKPF